MEDEYVIVHGKEHEIEDNKLDLSNNLIKNIAEIKGLNNLTDLQALILTGNPIKEIKGLDNLINLEELWLNMTQITEIKGLDNLINLRELVITYLLLYIASTGIFLFLSLPLF